MSRPWLHTIPDRKSRSIRTDRGGRRAASRHHVLPDLGSSRLEDRTLLSFAGASNDQILQTYGQIPLSFEVNQGQTAAQVDFLSRGSGYALFLTPTETVLSLQKSAPAAGDGAEDSSSAMLRSRFVGANPQPQVVGLDRLAGRSNYLIGSDPSQWHTNIANYGAVEYRNLYPGVDLVYHGNQRQLEYDYVVAPGTDPGVIKLAIDGAESMTIDGQGNLVLHTSGGDVLEMRRSSTRRAAAFASPSRVSSCWRATARSASPWVPTTTPNRWSSIRS